MTAYDGLANVYEWLVPAGLLEPAGSVAAFAPVVDELGPGARVLDCACGTGQLAVGLALRGFEVTASDASEPMVRRTRDLAARHGARLHAETRVWEEIAPKRHFDAVFCVGNSITHAPGRPGRRAALSAMAGALRAGGVLAVTSRNWELLRAANPGLEVADRLTERAGRRGLVIHAWTIPEAWEAPHHLEVAVAQLAEGAVTTHHGRLEFFPFTHAELGDDLRAAGLDPVSSTYAPDVERYLVTSRAS
jgi:SAM-dependent methyltransferase